jgi:hypothetical protein
MTKRHLAARSSLIRSLDRHPGLPALMRDLPPHAAATLIQRVGVADATEIMAVMPTRSLLRALDESIWKQPAPGVSGQVDADQLVEWFEAWLAIGEPFLLERLAAMGDDYLVLLLARVIAVDSTNRYVEADDAFAEVAAQLHDDAERFGPFVVTTIDDSHREVLRLVLNALWIEDRARLWRVLNRLDAMPEDEGGRRGWTATALDVEFERNSFRAGIGFVSGDDARALLATAAVNTSQQILAMTAYDPITERMLRARDAPDIAHPVIADDIDDVDDDDEADATSSSTDLVALDAAIRDAASLRSLLEEAELLDAHPPQHFLGHNGERSERPLTALLRALADEKHDDFARATRELAHLANVLKSGATIEARELTETQAREAAFATCNLGVELARANTTTELAREPGLIRYFMLGWRALAATRGHVLPAFVAAITDMPASWIRDEVTVGVRDLSAALEKNAFGDARECVIFLSIAFDGDSCHAITLLLDDLPRAGTSQWIESTDDLDRIATLLAGLTPEVRARPEPRVAPPGV